MALILSIETSAVTCSVALHESGRLVNSLEILEGQAHASKLATLIENLFVQTQLQKSDVKAIAVSGGPGSYTGLRIGVSTAKGLCLGLGVPLLSVSTTLSLAWQVFYQARVSCDYVCALVDAKRLEVYCEVFDSQLNSVRPIEAVENLTIELLFEFLEKGRVALVGDGAKKYEGTISHPNAVLLSNIYPKAEFMGALAFDAFESSKTENLVNYAPFYLKDFVAKKAKSFF